MATDTTKQSTPESNLNTSFMGKVQEKLLEQSGIISSTTSNLEQKISSAIEGVKSSTESETKRIESEFGRNLDYTKETAQENLMAGRAAGSGGILNLAALRELTNTTDKQLKDLEQRKQEMILANNSAGASKIAELELKALEFRQQAQQQTFANLLGIANFGIQSAQEERLSKQQTFMEKQAISEIALTYGLPVKEGDTIDTITSKAMVFASEEQRARLAKINAEIKYTNAQTAKILAGDKEANSVTITPEITEKLAMRWSELEAKGFTSNTSNEMENILAKFSKAGKESEFYDAIGNLAKSKAQAQIETKQGKTKAPQPSAFAIWSSKLLGEKPAGWQQLPDGTWRKI